MTIVEYKPEYKGQIGELISTIQRQEYELPIRLEDQPDLADIPKFYQVNSGNFWLAVNDNVLMGTIALIDIGNGCGVIRKMFVARPYRGSKQGVAANLLAHLENYSLQKQFRNLSLGTTTKFLAAHRFYEKHGYERIDESLLPANFPRMAVDSVFYYKSLSN